MKLTIAIPTYRNFKQLVDCLMTMTRYTEVDCKIVVVNNGPRFDQDGTDLEKEIRAIGKIPDLHFIHADENLGWQRSINRAFEERCDTELFCLCNDDLVFIPWHRNFFRQMCGYFQFADVGAVGPCTNYVMGSQSLWDHRGKLAFETTLLIGFCMVVRSSLFSEIGGLDEGLIGGDDLDLSILIRKAGYKLLVDRSCYVHHIGSQTGPRVATGYWNTPDHIDVSNNALIRKHGVRAWYECISSQIKVYEPITQTTDAEGDLIRQWVDGRPSGIDIGCGANKTLESAVGVDKQAKGEVGRAGGRKGTESVADVVGDATALPFDDGSQDYIIARHVFEHLLDPLAALKEWHRILGDGGIVAIACPDQTVCNSMILDFTHLHAYTPETLGKLLAISGFEITEVQRFPKNSSFAVLARKRAKKLEAVA